MPSSTLIRHRLMSRPKPADEPIELKSFDNYEEAIANGKRLCGHGKYWIESERKTPGRKTWTQFCGIAPPETISEGQRRVVGSFHRLWQRYVERIPGLIGHKLTLEESQSTNIGQNLGPPPFPYESRVTKLQEAFAEWKEV